jgi:hypothetical protein
MLQGLMVGGTLEGLMVGGALIAVAASRTS